MRVPAYIRKKRIDDKIAPGKTSPAATPAAVEKNSDITGSSIKNFMPVMVSQGGTLKVFSIITMIGISIRMILSLNECQSIFKGAFSEPGKGAFCALILAGYNDDKWPAPIEDAIAITNENSNPAVFVKGRNAHIIDMAVMIAIQM
jgi:hypothetical protein